MKKQKARLIEFYPASPGIEGVFDPPRPAKDFLPAWYKAQQNYINGQKSIGPDGTYNSTVKQCMPALDAMTAGYIIPTPQDIEVVDDPQSGVSIRWPSGVFKQISSHSVEQANECPLDPNVWDIRFWKFNNPWIIKTPPGYSCLFTTPLWQEGLPFKCFPGIVDTDAYINAINFPFVLRRDFRGLIEMGTPMIQVIPFKRENWKNKVGEESAEDLKKWEKSKRKFGNRYKKDYRSIKEYR